MLGYLLILNSQNILLLEILLDLFVINIIVLILLLFVIISNLHLHLHFISQQSQLENLLLKRFHCTWLLEKNLTEQFAWLRLLLGMSREVLLLFILTITWPLPSEWTVRGIK